MSIPRSEQGPSVPAPDHPQIPQCKSRSGVWRQVHSWDKDGLCVFCDTRKPGLERREDLRGAFGEYISRKEMRRREGLLRDYGLTEEAGGGLSDAEIRARLERQGEGEGEGGEGGGDR